MLQSITATLVSTRPLMPSPTPGTLEAFGALAREQYGNWVSVIGLVITIFGFIMTYRAAVEAKNAAKKAIEKVGRQLLSSDVDQSMVLINELDNLMRYGEWQRATDRCSQLKMMISSISVNGRITTDEKLYLNDTASQDIREISVHLDRICEGKVRGEIPRQMKKKLHDAIDMLGRLKSRLRNMSLEE